MDASDAVDLARNAILVALLVSSPLLLVGLAVGLVIGLMQALTQIQDQTVSFVPKLVATVAAMAFCLPWILQRMVEYSQDLYVNIPKLLAGG